MLCVNGAGGEAATGAGVGASCRTGCSTFFTPARRIHDERLVCLCFAGGLFPDDEGVVGCEGDSEGVDDGEEIGERCEVAAAFATECSLAGTDIEEG